MNKAERLTMASLAVTFALIAFLLPEYSKAGIGMLLGAVSFLVGRVLFSILMGGKDAQ